MAILKIDAGSSDEFSAEYQAVGKIIDEMLEAAGDIVEKQWRATMTDKQHIKDKAMYNGVQAKRGVNSADGEYKSIKIYPRGKDKKGKSNAQKAFYIHYGTQLYGKTHITGDHWVDEVRQKSDNPALAEMERIWKNKHGG